MHPDPTYASVTQSLYFAVRCQKPSLLALNPGSRDIDLSLDDLPGRSADGVPLLDRVLKVKDILDILCEVLRQVLPLLQREVGDLALQLLGKCDRSPGDVVRLSEWDLLVSLPCAATLGSAYSLADEVIGDVSGEHVHRQGLGHVLRVDLE